MVEKILPLWTKLGYGVCDLCGNLIFTVGAFFYVAAAIVLALYLITAQKHAEIRR